MYIYKTTNLIDGRIYLGKSNKDFNPLYLGSGLFLKRAVRKYGSKNFKVEVICYLNTEKQLNEFEKFIIEKYSEILGRDRLYNIALGGEGGDTLSNNPNIEEIKNRMRLSCKRHFLGKKHSEKTLELMRMPKTNKQIEGIKKGWIKRKLKGYKINIWNKGLTKETDIRVKKMADNLKGKTAWNKGLKKSIL